MGSGHSGSSRSGLPATPEYEACASTSAGVINEMSETALRKTPAKEIEGLDCRIWTVLTRLVPTLPKWKSRGGVTANLPLDEGTAILNTIAAPCRYAPLTPAGCRGRPGKRSGQGT